MHHKERKTSLKIGTINCRGLTKKLKKNQLANDAQRLGADIMVTQETKIKNTSTFKVKTSDGKEEYTHYNSGNSKSHHGVGILVKKGTQLDFTPVNERLCISKVKLERKDQKLVVITAYAPTLVESEKTPSIREEFYDKLDSIVNSISNRDILVIAGDFNAKTGSVFRKYKENMGKFGKGKIMEMGQNC